MISNILEGIQQYGAAVRHIGKYNLWGYVLLPAFISLLLLAGIFSFSFGLSDDIGLLLGKVWPWDWGKSIFDKVAQVFGGLILLALGAVLFKQIMLVVLAPFMSLLSTKVEHQLTGRKDESRFSLPKAIREILRGLRLAMRNVTREMLATVVLLLLGLFPVFTPFTTLLLFLLQSYYAGFGNTDFALERHYGYRASIGYIHRNRGVTLGNGIVFMFLFLSIVGFVFALPLATVAATIQTVKRLADTTH